MNIHPQTPKEHYYLNRSESRKSNSDRYQTFIKPNLQNWETFNQIKTELAPKIEEIKSLDEVEVLKEANRRATDSSRSGTNHNYRLVSAGAESIRDKSLRFAKEKREFEVSVD